MAQAPNDPDIKTLSFEKALEKLEHIVQQLEKGSVPLEESIIMYEYGEELKKHCDSLLKNAEFRIEKMTLNKNLEPTGTTAFEEEK